MPSHTDTVPPKATRREWLGLAVIALPCILYSMDLTVLHLALPTLSAALAPSASQLLWIVDIYGFIIAGSLITMGTLGDRIGRRRLLLIGAVAFGVASIFAAFARSAGMLIVARALLGAAGATLAPSTLSLIRNMFHDPDQRTAAIGIWAASFSFGAVIGPLVGGILLNYFWWGSVFLAAVPVMVMLVIVAPILLPEYRDPGAGRIDLFSALLSLTAFLAVIHGLKKLAEGVVTVVPFATIVAGLVIGWLFVRRQRRLADPLIDLRLFRMPGFVAALATYTLTIFAMFGTYLFFAQYLQLVLGLSPLTAGLWTIPSSFGFIAGSILAPQMVKVMRPAYAMALGLAVMAVGFAVLTQVDGPGSLPILVTGSIIFALGSSAPAVLPTDIIITLAPAERAGAASGISETSAEFGGALGMALLGSLGAVIYRIHVVNAVPVSLPPDVAEAARGSLGGGLAAAAQLGGPVGAALQEAAREAFTRAFVVNAAIVTVITAVMAVVIAVALSRVRRGGTPEVTGPAVSATPA